MSAAAPRARVLVVEDEALFARAVVKRLARDAIDAQSAGTLAAARAWLADGPAEAVLLDMRLPDGSGMSLLPELAALEPRPPVIVLTAFAGLDDAVAAMKAGASDYLTKPIDLDELSAKVEAVLSPRGLTPQRHAAAVRHGTDAAPAAGTETALIGDSAVMRDVRSEIARIQSVGDAAGERPTVLLLGETGSGKDVVARALHAGSPRGNLPFVHVDCAALPKGVIEAELFGHARGAFTSAHAARTGLIEAAGAGTLFLDEVGELPLDVQSRLLAVLERRRMRRVGATEETPVPAWFIAATNRDLPTMVADGRFRADLFYRLEVMPLRLPPLRDRGDDVLALSRHYAALRAAQRGLEASAAQFSPAAEQALLAHRWPGNVRELINVIERALLRHEHGPIEVADLGLDPAPARRDDAPGTLPGTERDLIIKALEASGGNVSAAARQLGVSRMTLRYRLDKYGIDRGPANR